MAGLQTRGRRSSGQIDTSSGGETSSDRRARRSAARERDDPLERAYEAGRRGGDRAEFATSDELAGYYDDGAKLASDEARLGRRDARNDKIVGGLSGQASAAGAKAGSAANDGAGFLLGLFAYALLANYLRFGVPGVKGWLAAKFLNKPTLKARA